MRITIKRLMLLPVIVCILIALFGTGVGITIAETISRATASSSALRADFNGDGFADLAIGVPGEDIGTIVDAGCVNVLYGSSAGLSATNNQLWHQDSSGVKDLCETEDKFGSVLAVGDFNGDGFADLAIAAPYEDVGTVVDAGAVNVLYGSSTGLSSTGNQFWSQDSYAVEDSCGTGDLFGYALTAGDFNGDGFADLAIGVPFEDVAVLGYVGDAGAVNVLYGSSAGLNAKFPSDQLWHQDTPGVQGSCGWGDRFGCALAAGYFNGDGFADLAIGVVGEDVGTNNDAGGVNVLYGSSTGLSTSGNQLWHQNKPNVQGAAEPNDYFGYALAAGDFNRDSLDDLAIGVIGEDIGTIVDAGCVNVLYGSSTGLSATNNQLWHQDSQAVEDACETSDYFGFALVANDFNGDRFDDLAIGVPGENIGTTVDAGAVNVLYGSSSGLSSESPPDQRWHQNSSGVEDAVEKGDRFGCTLTAGDFNGDHRDDLAIGVPFEDVGTKVDAGAVNVLYGSPTRLSATGDQFWHQNSLGVQGVAESNDYFSGKWF